MTDARTEAEREAVDLQASPFLQPPVAGIPYESGSEEDRAIRAVISEAEQARHAGRSANPKL